MSANNTSRAALARPHALHLDIDIDDGAWEPIADVERMLAPLAATVATAVALPHPVVRATVSLATDAVVRDVNNRFRQQDKATNVLSFPASGFVHPGAADGVSLGDIILARETLERESAEQAIPVADHFRHLVLHGLLHLVGYDHETDADAEVMEALETRILAQLGIPDPYRDPPSNEEH